MNDSFSRVDENTIIFQLPGKAGRTIKPGDVLGDNYRLTALIGCGGMGVVYRCRHQIIGKDYALKLLDPRQVNEQRWQRFQIEGKAIAKLNHPNIVKIFNMGVDGSDCPYYVMELLEGESLGEYIDTNGCPGLPLSFDIFAQLASGLSYAHSRGIIHRDIKPSNIILLKEGDNKFTAKIVDFGLAKLVDRDSQAGQSLTSAGEVFGSPFYMSPEQSMGVEIDARADIYSLGCTFFKTLTGKPPFYGESAFQTILMHQEQAVPSLNSVGEDKVFPRALEDLLQKMLAKRPEHRHQSMDQVGHDITRLQEGKSLEKSGLSDLNARDQSPDPKELNFLSLKSHWRFITATFVLASGLAAIGVYFSWFKAGHVPGTAGGAEERPTQAEARDITMPTHMFEPDKVLPDESLAQARANYAAFKFKALRHFTYQGNKVVEHYFPQPAIAELQVDDNHKQPAAGTVRLAPPVPVALEIDRTKHRYTWAYPWVLKQIDSAEITDVTIAQESYTDALPDGTGVEATGEGPILEMLAILKNWKDIKGIHFRESTLSQKAFEAVEAFPHLRRFTLKRSDNTGSDLVKCRFIHKLQWLHVQFLKQVDPLIFAVSGSKNLNTIVLDGTNPSPAAIKSLSACPNLFEISLERTQLGKDQLIALSQLPELRFLYIKSVKLDPAELAQMSNFSRLKGFFVTDNNWTPYELHMVQKAFPNCTVSALSAQGLQADPGGF